MAQKWYKIKIYMGSINEKTVEKDLKSLLDSTCESINKVNELSAKFNIDDDLFRKLFDTDPKNGFVSTRVNFMEIYNSEVKKH
jgi:hypothetical protein